MSRARTGRRRAQRAAPPWPPALFVLALLLPACGDPTRPVEAGGGTPAGTAERRPGTPPPPAAGSGTPMPSAAARPPAAPAWEVVESVTFRGLRIEIARRDAFHARLRIHRGDALLHERESARLALGPLHDDPQQAQLLEVGRDVTGNGRPDLVYSEHTGDGGCCLRLHVLELLPQVRVVDTVDAGATPQARFVELDDRPGLELAIVDDSYRAWFRETTAYMPPLILRFDGDAYRLATDLMYREPAPARSRADLARALRGDPAWARGRAPEALVREVIDLVYTGHPDLARELAGRAWPPDRSGQAAWWTRLCAAMRASPFAADLDLP